MSDFYGPADEAESIATIHAALEAGVTLLDTGDYDGMDLLVASKRGRALEDPEPFATYVEPTTTAREVVRAHVATLTGQLARIVADGIAQGEFAATDPATAGRAVFDATARFHNPTHAPEWSDPGIDAAFEGVRSLVLLGLGAQAADRG